MRRPLISCKAKGVIGSSYYGMIFLDDFLRAKIFCAILPPTMTSSPSFLFSVDLEDIRMRIPDGFRRPPRVHHNTQRLMAFMNSQGVRCTFFVVGQLVEDEPELIAQIVADGHEIGCHTHTHTPLDQLGPDGFRRDLELNLRSLSRAGVSKVQGFRSPCASLTARTAWAYEILREFGFTYSSSVIPAPNPINGWPGFGQEIRQVDGIWEVPISLTEIPGFRIPHSSGVYLRALPYPLVAWAYSFTLRRRGFVSSYIHPYDVDHEEDRVDIPELKGSKFFNWLFYFNRQNVFGRLERLLKRGGTIRTYQEFLEITGHLSPATSSASCAR